jgi:hypothetical protein
LGARLADLAGLALHVADERILYAMSTHASSEPEHLAVQFTSVPHAVSTSEPLSFSPHASARMKGRRLEHAR